MKTRQQPRKPIDVVGHCRSARGMQWDVTLADISENGCRVLLPHGGLAIGEAVKLFIAGSGPHRARTQWRDGEEIGVRFDRPLAAGLIEQIRAGLTHAATRHAPADASHTPGFGRRTGLGPVRFV